MVVFAEDLSLGLDFANLFLAPDFYGKFSGDAFMLVVDDDCVQRATTSKNQSELGGRTITVTATIREELYNRVGVCVACVATVGDARACNVVRVRGLGPKVTLEAVSAMFPPPLQVEENGKKFGSQRGITTKGNWR